MIVRYAAKGYCDRNAARLHAAKQRNDSADQLLYARRLQQWKSELASATAAVGDCHSEMAELRDRMLNDD